MKKNLIVTVVLVLSVTVFVGGATWAVINGALSRDSLCRNQHDLAVLNRLFLEEHAAIRRQLQHADIPTTHADPDLLKQIEARINAADCRVAGD